MFFLKKLPLIALLSILFLGTVAVGVGYASLPPNYATEFDAPAIALNGSGMMVHFIIYSREGSGNAFVDVRNDRVFQDTQASFRKAVNNAGKYLGKSLDKEDYFLVLGNEKSISGESAGAFLTVAVIAHEEGRKLNQSVSMSAVIGENGELYPVLGVEEKMIAASEDGKKEFLITQDQKVKGEALLSERIRIRRISTLDDAVRGMIENG